MRDSRLFLLISNMWVAISFFLDNSTPEDDSAILLALICFVFSVVACFLEKRNNH